MVLFVELHKLAPNAITHPHPPPPGLSFDAAMAMATSETILFSDSDTDNDHSTSPGAASRGSFTFGESTSIPALPVLSVGSALNKSLAGSYTSEDDVEATATEKMKSAAEDASAAASSAVLSSSSSSSSTRGAGSNGHRAGSVKDLKTADAAVATGSAPAPLRPPPKRAVSKVDDLTPAASAKVSSVITPSSAPPAAISESASSSEGAAISESEDPGVGDVEGAAVAPAATDGDYIRKVAPSAAPRPASSFMARTAPVALSPKFGGKGRRARSSLGRLGAVGGAKVTIPIAGGRAAWTKFLATAAAAPEGADCNDDAATSAFCDDGEGHGDAAAAPALTGGDGADLVGSKDGSSAVVGEAASPSEARGMRGFDKPVSHDGPSKGPAGAFTGNAMWRLAGGGRGGGAGAYASRARSGVAANGHGGYSNPLAAMRAAPDRTTTSAPEPRNTAEEGRGIVANPISGLRGAASIGGAGVANPLARGRGRGPRPGGGEGRTGNANTNATNRLARASNGGANFGALTATPAATATAADALPQTSVGCSDGGNGAAILPGSMAPVGAPLPAAAAVGPAGVGAFAAESTKRAATGATAARGGLGTTTVEFRAIGNYVGSRGTSSRNGGLPLPPRRQARARHQMEWGHDAGRDPGQARVASVVVRILLVLGKMVGRAAGRGLMHG